MPYIHMPFPLDQSVSRFHKRIGINTPEDITEKAIAARAFSTFNLFR
jgi:hypothetical protein